MWVEGGNLLALDLAHESLPGPARPSPQVASPQAFHGSRGEREVPVARQF